MKKSLLILLTFTTVNLLFADEWPCFRGPARDGTSKETGLLKSWPKEGPKLLWEYQGIGGGFSSACIANKHVYLTGMLEKKGWTFCLSDDGKLKWKHCYGTTSQKSYKGPRTTPTYEDGLVYIYSAMGLLVCYDAETGDVKWQVDTVKDYQARNIHWSLTESLLVYKDKVICTPGGPEILMVALDKKTGKEIWSCKGLNVKSAYCSPLIVKHKGKDLLITNVEKNCIGIDPENGKLLWKTPLVGKYGQNQVTPVYHDGYVFITNARGATPKVFKIADDGKSVKDIWQNKDLEVNIGCVVLKDKHLYGTTKKGWVCQDMISGKKAWSERGVGEASVILADGMIYGYSYKGELVLIDASAEKLKTLSKFKLPKSSLKNKNFSHPGIANGKLYIRHGDKLMVFQVK